MIIKKQSASIISGLSPMEHIERVGRICYKSEDKISDGTASKFVDMLYRNKHHAMLEHYRFIMSVNPVIYDHIGAVDHPYIEMTDSIYDGHRRLLISFSARALINMVEDSNAADHGVLPMTIAGIRDELIGHIIKSYKCYKLFGKTENDIFMLSTGTEFIANSNDVMNEHEWYHHGWKSVHFVTDRGISHELVRHRPCSFAQESTRYCNYGLDKFGNEITVIDQGFEAGDDEGIAWKIACETAEKSYFRLLECGVKPQMARSVLPTCLKTEIVVTANMREWGHIFNLRLKGTTGAPHPMMKKLMELLPMEEFNYD